MFLEIVEHNKNYIWCNLNLTLTMLLVLNKDYTVMCNDDVTPSHVFGKQLTRIKVFVPIFKFSFRKTKQDVDILFLESKKSDITSGPAWPLAGWMLKALKSQFFFYSHLI